MAKYSLKWRDQIVWQSPIKKMELDRKAVYRSSSNNSRPSISSCLLYTSDAADE